MVITGAVLNLLVVGIVDALAHNMRCAEVEGRALHLADFTRGYRGFVDGNIEISVDFADRVHRRGRGVADALEREETVAGHVDHRLLVGRTAVVNHQFVVVRPRVAHRHGEFSGESLLVVGRNVAEHEGVVVDLFGIPNARMETGGSSVEVIRSIVHREVIFFAVELEFSFGDAVAVASHECGKEWLGRIYAVVDVVVSLNHVGKLAFSVRHHNGHECTTIVCDGNFAAICITQDIQIRFLASDFLLEVGGFQSAESLSIHCLIKFGDGLINPLFAK